MNVRAQGEGFFARNETRPYNLSGRVIGQAHFDSCLAACCRMLLQDEGQIVDETSVRAALDADPEGAYLSAAPFALKLLGARRTYIHSAELNLADLRSAVMRGAAVVFVKDDPQSSFGHAVIVDGIVDEYAWIRDPWPLASGSAYQVKLADFEAVWFARVSESGFTGQAVVVE